MHSGNRVLLALVAGLVVGGAIAASGNPALLKVADVAAPIGTLWINAIRMTLIPLIVSLLVTAIASAADLRALGRIGGRTLLVFVALLTLFAVLMVPLAPRIFALMPAASAGRAALPPGAAEAAGALTTGAKSPTFVSWLLSLIPSNPIAAAAEGAMLPLILFTVLFSLAVSRSPVASRDTLLGFFQALSETMMVLVRGVIALAPIGVFALVLSLVARSGLGLVGAIGFYITVYSLAGLAFILLLYPIVAIAAKVPMRQFARAVLPAQLIAFSSSSSIASLPALVQGAEEELAIPPRVAGFVLPLAVSVFKLASPISWPMGALFVARFYGVELHATQLVTIALAAIFLAFGAPGIPRGAFLMLAPLFSAIGLPVEGIGILIAVDAIPDTFATTVNVTGNMAAVAIINRYETPIQDTAD